MTSLLKIEYLPAAQKDREDMFNYIAKENHDAAVKALEEFDASVARLKQSPLLGTIPKNARMARLGYRNLNVKNYEIFYTVNDDIIEIHHIIHGWLKKSK
jgi:toxin ParE1/3/4